MRIYRLILLIVLAGLLNSCRSQKYETYTGPPPRTTSLDSTVRPSLDPFIHPPDTLEISFEVPRKNPCPVKVEVRNALNRLVRVIIDSTYTPGSYKHRWYAADSLGQPLKNQVYYYNLEICGQLSTFSFDYRLKRH